jgi:hypothetical protein
MLALAAHASFWCQHLVEPLLLRLLLLMPCVLLQLLLVKPHQSFLLPLLLQLLLPVPGPAPFQVLGRSAGHTNSSRMDSMCVCRDALRFTLWCMQLAMPATQAHLACIYDSTR